MTCTTIVLPGGVRGIVCTRGRTPSCAFCRGKGRYRCDAPHPARRSRTCDRWLCERHRIPAGPGRDCCPDHAQQALAWREVEMMKPIGLAAAAAVDHVAQLRDVRAQLGDLDQHQAPGDVPLVRWRALILDSRRFIDAELAFLALEYGWTVPQLWAANRERPYARLDQQGLCWLLEGATIEDLGAAHCVLVDASGSRLTYRRRDTLPAAETALPWEL